MCSILEPLAQGTLHDINCVVADGSPESRLNVKFVQDTSKFWYKPDISREQGEMQRFVFSFLTIKKKTIETVLFSLCLLLYFVKKSKSEYIALLTWTRALWERVYQCC